MGEAGGAGAEVDRVDPGGGELRDGRPGLLRLDGEAPGLAQALRERGVDDHRRGLGVPGDRHLGLRGLRELADALLGLGGRAIRRVAVVEEAARAVGDHVRRDSTVDPGRAHHLDEAKPRELGDARGHREDAREPGDGVLDRVLPLPGPRRVRALALEDELGVQVAEAAHVERRVRGLEDDGELGLERVRARREEGGKRALLLRQLLAWEEEERDVGGELRALLVEPARELDHHREPALHVARAEAVDEAVLDRAGDVPLRGNRVQVAGEEDERRVRRGASC